MDNQNRQPVTGQDFDKKFQVKSEIEHVLTRTGMWLGDINTNVINYPLFVPSKNKIQQLPNIGYNPGLLKLIDEILSNSVDEFRRKDALFPITEISVEINTNGVVTISDNGGIPVQMHKETGLLIPELIFGHLRTSSNYDDTEERSGVGTNGLGAKLTNIFSKQFSVTTSDGKNSVHIIWENNMRNSNKDSSKNPSGFEIIKTQTNGTIIQFLIELDRFEMEEIPLSIIRIVQKRCIDAAAANPGLLINFKSDIAEGRLNSIWQFNSFEEYVKLYLTDEQIKSMIKYQSKKDTIILLPENIGFNFGLINGGICSEGSHIKKIQNQITDYILALCEKSDMELLTEKDVLNRLTIFVNATISNPTYDSQSKDKLTNKIDKFTLNFSKEFLQTLGEGELFESLKDYYSVKYAEVKKKELRKLNAIIKSTNSKKLISCAAKDSKNAELWLFEGTSASNGFRKARNLYQSAYLLRGKIKNTFNLKKEQILENLELREVLAALNILFNEDQKNIKTLKFAKIVFAADMDYDGNHICGLLLAFFAKHFPELFKAGKIYRALSPIIIANKGKSKKYYYSMPEYHDDEKNLKGYEITYMKGLGGLEDEDYYQMLRNQKLIKFTLTSIKDLQALDVWFNKSTEMRKQLLLEDASILVED
jgi:DNA gyrase/topoisomerase IV subunit B